MLKKRLPVIISAVSDFAEKYGIVGAIGDLKTALVGALTKVADKAQEFTDMIQSEFLNHVSAKISALYNENIRLVNSLIEELTHLFNIDNLKVFVDKCIKLLLNMVKEFKNAVPKVFPTNSEAMINIHNERVNIDVSLPFYY